MSRTSGLLSAILLLAYLAPFSETHGVSENGAQTISAPTKPISYTSQNEEEEEEDDENLGDDAIFSLDDPSEKIEKQPQQHQLDRIIKSIEIVRQSPNKYITAASIYNHLPFHEGVPFDRFATNQLIKKLYELDIFEQIEVRASILADEQIALYIIVDEEPELDELVLKGNRALSEKDIEESLQTSKLKSVSPRKTEMLKRKLIDAYRKKNYHSTEINVDYEVVDGKAIVTFNIVEGPTSLVKRIFFKGNNCISEKRLKAILNTQEDWILSFMNHGGCYDPDMLEKDKRNIESFYKMEGFFDARLLDAEVTKDPVDGQFLITFTVAEGEIYHFGELRAQSNEILTEKVLLSTLEFETGDVYSSKKLWEGMETLKKVWGSLGYVFVDIQPNMVPNRETRTIDITFEADLGDKVFARRINIVGNNKTRDKVIRRKLLVAEGDLLTNNKLEGSKERVQGLSFFDTKEDGVQWKINRANEKEADVDLIVKEAKTGRVALQAGYGGSPDNPGSAAQTLSISGSIFETNLFGQGMQLNLTGQWSAQEWTASGTFVDPYFMDMPVLLENNIHYTKTNRASELNGTEGFQETSKGASIGTGYLFQQRWMDIITRSSIGIESINMTNRPKVKDPNSSLGKAYQTILDMRFQPGTMGFIQTMIAQDLRNHVYHPSRGYQWMATLRVGLPIENIGGKRIVQPLQNVGAITTTDQGILQAEAQTNSINTQNIGVDNQIATQINAFRCGLGFVKLDMDASWYTPLIGERWLIFGIHAHAGFVNAIKNYVIPYKELYHVGGAMTVRGWEWGQLGPTFMGDSIGACKEFYLNAELIFPIRPDYSIKGCFFYDGGTGWDTPTLDLTPSMRQALRNNNFDYRHSIGFGVRMLQPQPMRIDWGFKLDRRKNEKHMEVHFNTYREF
jgi:outer membrane protein insertion porin family